MRKALLAALLLAAIGIGCVSVPARASEAIRGLNIVRAHEPGRIDLGPGGAFLFQRYLAVGDGGVTTDSSATLPFQIIAGKDTLHLGTVARTVTMTAAAVATVRDSLIKGGVPGRTIKYFLDCGTRARIAAGRIRIYGTNACGDTISEGITISNDTQKYGQTTKAFNTITSVALPAGDSKSPLLRFTKGTRIGMPFTTALDGQASVSSEGNGTLIAWWKDGVAQTAPIADSIGVSATDIESCTIGLAAITAMLTYDFLYYLPPYQGTTARTKW